MTKDPVCGMNVDDKNAPASTVFQGKQLSFCSEECKQRFEKDSQQYVTSKSDKHTVAKSAAGDKIPE